MELPHTIETSTRLELSRKIAEGGMGAVYEARQFGAEGFEKTVAVKFLLPNLTDNRHVLDLFIAEAKLVANLVHENIIQIYQFGHSEKGYYIVMEYVNGIPLDAFISYHKQTNTPLPVELAVFIISRIARGLAYAHKRRDKYGEPLGIVHRDVCPNNIMLTTEGLPKLGDFGVAQVAKSGLRSKRFLVGKRLFMAPEQADKQDVDFRADIFSLGTVLFKSLCFENIRTDEAVRTADISEIAAMEIPWGLIPRDTPSGLINILRKMLHLRREERYQDTDKLARDLEFFIYQHGYGPTIQTLEAYLKRHFQHLYDYTVAPPKPSTVNSENQTVKIN